MSRTKVEAQRKAPGDRKAWIALGSAAAKKGLPRSLNRYPEWHDGRWYWDAGWCAASYFPGNADRPAHVELPVIRTVEDLDLLPWGGNAWWDVPIMNHVDRVGRDPAVPREQRMAIVARAGHLMTGEDCEFKTDAEFDDYLAMSA